jgi:GAF domain-containing protein
VADGTGELASDLGSDVLEAVAETARWVLRAASLTLSRVEGRTVRCVINVGDLGPGEVRWPRGEVYSLDDFPESVRILLGLLPGRAITHVDDADSEPAEVALLRRLEKVTCLKVAIVVHGLTWGELWASRTAEQPPFGPRDVSAARDVAGVVAAGLTA